jgi:hypothetical protein
MSYLMRGVLLLFFGILCSGAQAQTVSGQLLLLADQDVKLMAFDGFNTPLIAQGKIDAEGRFSLGYAPNDYGVGYLTSADDKPFIVILSGEDVELVGEALSMPETIRITKGQQNQWFEQYAKEHPTQSFSSIPIRHRFIIFG